MTDQQSNQPNQSNQQLLKLSLLLLLEQRLRSCQKDELPFIIVNETAKIIMYQQAILWQPHNLGKRKIVAVSGVSVLDPNSPFFQSVKKLLALIKHELKELQSQRVEILSVNNFSENIRKKWIKWFPENALWCPLTGPGHQGDIQGFVIFFRHEPFSDPDKIVMSHLSSAFGHALAYKKKNHVIIKPIPQRIKRVLLTAFITLSLFALFFFPIRQFSMAQSEIVPVNPSIVRAPLDGIIRIFYKSPNESVKKGEPILELDDVKLRSQLDIAQKKLQIVKVQLMQSQQMAFTDQEAKGKIDLLSESVKQEQAEVEYIKALLERVVVHASDDGILIFEDPDEWIGRPVAIGEKIMLLANPDEIELKISMPVKESIELHKGGDVNFFLNIAPTHPLKATVRYINYSTHITPDNVVAYLIRASFSGTSPIARIGLKGTAKLYGPQTRLGLWALRKPINVVQRFLNL